MKTINLTEDKLDLEALITLAREEPVMLLTADGKEFVLAEADDFDQEVAALRASPAFQRFLDERSRSTRRISLEEVEAQIDRELAARRKT
ncbi:MAG: hypothetical protein ACREQ2_06960 [Candidatus Binatia bacterium]